MSSEPEIMSDEELDIMLVQAQAIMLAQLDEHADTEAGLREILARVRQERPAATSADRKIQP